MKPENGFTKLPNAVYGVLSLQEIALYSYLTHRQGSNRSAWWSRKAIALELNASEGVIKRLTQSLISKGWLSTHRPPKNSKACPTCGAPSKAGWQVNHYSVLTPSAGQNHASIGVTSDLLKRTKKNNQQTKQVSSASEPASHLAEDEVFILEKPSESDLSLSDLPILEKLNELEISQPDILPAEVLLLDKQKDAREEGISRNTREKPFPESVALLKALPTETASQITLTAEINSLVSQLLLTRGRTISELGINLAEEFRKPGIKNPGGFLTHLLRRYLENGYTPKETSGQPLVAWSMENPPPYCGVCDPETRKNDFWSELPDGNGAKTLSCLICNPFMVNKYGGRLKTRA
jgi:hypothetical protein